MLLSRLEGVMKFCLLGAFLAPQVTPDLVWVRAGIINKVRLAMERFSRAEGRQISARPILQSRAALRGHYSLAACLVGEQVGTDP